MFGRCVGVGVVEALASAVRLACRGGVGVRERGAPCSPAPPPAADAPAPLLDGAPPVPRGWGVRVMAPRPRLWGWGFGHGCASQA